ncbi:MAG: ComEC/Rec2 family competence protein, partial [Microbacterium sp.]|nr:ComEC/Rec2 family competence protein [Microbacterium sp.]
MRRRDARLVPVAPATWLAAGVATFLPAASPWIALALWGTAFGAAGIGVLRARRSVVIALIVVSAALSAGAASHVALAQPSRSSAGTLAIGGGRAVSVTATVVGKAEATRAGDLSFDAQAHGILVGTRTTALDVPVLVRSAPGVRPDIGAEVRIDGTVQVADPGERAVLIVRAGRSLTVLRPPGGALAVTAALRHRLLAATRGLPEPGAGLIAGLAVGDTSAVGADLDEAMKASSLSHLTAVSGANCALVVGLAFAAASACRARRGIRVASGLVSLAGFVALVTPEPSVVRAAAMAAIAMLGVLLGRRGAGISLLCVAICAVLIADPWLASSLGFALSVAATGALLILARPLAEGLARWMPRAIALGLSVPLAAQLACGPLLVLINPTVSVYGVAANLLAAPAAPIATVVGLAACLAAPLPVLQSGLAAVTWLPAQWIAVTAEIARALPANAIAWPEGLSGMLLLGLVGAATT